MDSIIEEMSRRVLDWRQTLHRHDLERFARHLRDVVQPQLDELEALKAGTAGAKAAPKREKVSA